jgi:hypothetical protein
MKVGMQKGWQQAIWDLVFMFNDQGMSFTTEECFLDTTQ